MKPQKILVTGASGFLGCRLVERLVLGERVSVRAMAHRPGTALRLARLPVEIVWADIRDYVSVEKAMAGCDVVVHCAYAYGNSNVTVEGTRLSAEAALTQGVHRFVHISTIAVYSYSPPRRVDEQTPFLRSGDPYCDDKIKAEEVIWNFVRKKKLKATVLRLGNLYGPFSETWTVRPIDHIRNRFVALVDEGEHASNALFVDNAVEAILRAIKEDASVGEAFFVTDDEISWRTWYGHYAAWLDASSITSISSKELELLLHPPLMQRLHQSVNNALPVWRELGRFRPLTPLVNAISRRIPDKMRSWIKGEQSAGNSPILPPLGLLQRYASWTKFSSEKAVRILGYGPLIPFDKAIQVTERWARWARLI